MRILSLAAGFAAAFALGLHCAVAAAEQVKDLKYGAVLFEYYQQKYFETLVEFEYAAERGGIRNHGDYPELLKGGVSLSYGLERQAKTIFSKLIAQNTSEQIQNRAWFYLAKMLYLRGEVNRAATTLSNIHGVMPSEIDQEYRYLAALVNIKLGYYDAAESVSQSFDKRSPYAPYLYFNLGVAFGKQNAYARATANLDKAASYADGTDELQRLADRAHMAKAYLDAENQKFAEAYREIRYVSTTGVFSNRALLGSGWASINDEAYRDALAPLMLLQKRAITIPEVQEAVILVPHVYEKLGLRGRAAEGFIDAYDRYSDALVQLDHARAVLKSADVLELFVRNLDQMLGESDWFGTAPAVSLNELSPFLVELMSDHSFQSVLKELRDLYAIRNNLNSWLRKRDDFKVILQARTAGGVGGAKQMVSAYADQESELQSRYKALSERTAVLGAEDRERVQWLLDDIGSDIQSAGMMVTQMQEAGFIPATNGSFQSRVDTNMKALDEELKRTNDLIGKVEKVLLKLVTTELDIHEERIKYYRVQAHLAKARILDRSLGDLDVRLDEGEAAGQGDSKANPPGGNRVP